MRKRVLREIARLFIIAAAMSTLSGCVGWSYRQDLADAHFYDPHEPTEAAKQLDPEPIPVPSPVAEPIPMAEPIPVAEPLTAPDPEPLTAGKDDAAEDASRHEASAATKTAPCPPTAHCRRPSAGHRRRLPFMWPAYIHTMMTPPEVKKEHQVEPHPRFHPLPTYPVFHPPAEPAHHQD